jgi:predicted ribosome quality control (RQC) complex YloA/Tae2 family protein
MEIEQTLEKPKARRGRPAKEPVAQEQPAPIALPQVEVVPTPQPTISPEEKKALALAKARETRAKNAEAKRALVEAEKAKHEEEIRKLVELKAQLVAEQLKLQAEKDAQQIAKKKQGKNEERKAIKGAVAKQEAIVPDTQEVKEAKAPRQRKKKEEKEEYRMEKTEDFVRVEPVKPPQPLAIPGRNPAQTTYRVQVQMNPLRRFGF